MAFRKVLKLLRYSLIDWDGFWTPPSYFSTTKLAIVIVAVLTTVVYGYLWLVFPCTVYVNVKIMWIKAEIRATKGGGDTGVSISHIPDFLPPNIPYPRFFTPNIPYPRFFTPQYPISQISQSIDHIPDFARLECVCIHSFDIQLVRMDPILLDIFTIAINMINICAWEFLELHFNNAHHSNMYMGSH